MAQINNLNYLMHHLAAVLNKQSDQILQEQLGIGLSQYKILMVLEWNPYVKQKTIAESLGQTEASVTRQIKLLKAKGLIATKISPSNKRVHQNQPTPLGMQVTEAADSLLKKGLFQNMGSDESELNKLSDSLKQLHKAICRPGQIGACDHQFGL
jgi:DNA-binding MarR family transcriptional regulator